MADIHWWSGYLLRRQRRFRRGENPRSKSRPSLNFINPTRGFWSPCAMGCSVTLWREHADRNFFIEKVRERCSTEETGNE